MSKYLVYQGQDEKYRWRKETDEGGFIELGPLFETPEEAVAAVQAREPGAVIENRVQAQGGEQ